MPGDGGLHIDLGASLHSLHPPSDDSLPPLAAVFLIHFDIKAGYTLAWKKTSHPAVELDGVEFQSLPSGLHNLSEDLVYFVHGQYAGVSAFCNTPAAEEHRNALMLSVGVLVPLSYGRLGRSWRHAEGLKALARQVSADPSNHALLDDYFERHQSHDNVEPPPESPFSPLTKRSTTETQYSPYRHYRMGSVSEATLNMSSQTPSLSAHHPALSLCAFLDTFGPLVFPIYRAALARKRILLVCHAPVEQACNFVYNISILSNVPSTVANLLPTETYRLKPLFCVGVNDIPFLEEEAQIRKQGKQCGERGSWVACTTDEILAMKTGLYDVLIRMPPLHAQDAAQKVWPHIECPSGVELKATQRDLRRYRVLKQSLFRRYHRNSRLFLDSDDEEPLLAEEEEVDSDDEPNNIEDICENLTWREIAYSAFIWWASAGEKRTGSDDNQDDQDPLLDHHRFEYAPKSPFVQRSPSPVSGATTTDDDDETPIIQPVTSNPSTLRNRKPPAAAIRRRSTAMPALAGPEIDIIGYFHRSTARILTVLAEGAERGGDASVHGEEDEIEIVTAEEMDEMGVDRYSDRDAAWIEDVVERWWPGRKVQLERWRITCCGVECG